MKRLWRFILPIVLLFSASSDAFNVTTHIDNQIITTSTSFDFILSADTELPDDALDIRPLFRNFIIGNLRITHPTPTTTEWRIPLQPVSDGALTIPPLNIADTTTTPIPIQVLATNDGTVSFSTENSTPSASANLASPPEHVIETSISKDSFYPKEPVILNVTVAKHAIDNQQTPEVISTPDLTITSIGQPEQDSSIFGDHFQETLTYHYYVIAANSGSQTIPEVNVPNESQQTSEPIDIQVQSIPEKIEPSSWLPSAGISVEEFWEPQTSYAKANQLLTRTLKITGINNLPEQLPEIPLPDIKDVRVYLDTESTDLSYQNGMLISTKVIKQVFVPQSNRPFSTPSYGFHWWNTISDRAQYTELPSRRFQASANSDTTASAQQKETTPTQTVKNNIFAWFAKLATPAVLLTFVLAFVIFTLCIVIWFIQRKKITIWRQERRAWNEFKQICADEDGTPMEAYQHLLVWAELKWHHPFSCLEQLPCYEFAYIELSHLQAACFNKNDDDWSGNRLVKKIAAYKDKKETSPSRNPPEDSFHC